MAPEMNGYLYGPKVDVFSLGLVFEEIFAKDQRRSEIGDEIARGDEVEA